MKIFSVIDRITRPKISKVRDDLSNTIQDHDIPTQHNTTIPHNCCMEHSQSTWNAHEVRPHTSLKTSLNFFPKTEILKNMFSGSKRILLDINIDKLSGKDAGIWKVKQHISKPID